MPLGHYGARGTGGVAESRVRFLTDEPVAPGGVRDAILASWWRSRHHDVAADRIELPYIRDPDLDTPLARSAEPVLRSLAEHLSGQPISVVLTDASGLVLTRLTADAELERHLDRVLLAPGFSYAEEFVGTNGIGTALEGGGPMQVFGHEHYAERLEDLACAGVPIAHPATGKTIGALDLTCWRKDAGPLLTALAKTTTEQIRQALLTDTSMREVELLHEYLRACHRTGGLVLALNNDVVMVNQHARAALAPADQDALLRRAADSSFSRRGVSEVDLPSGQRVRITTNPVRGEGHVAGIVVQARLLDVRNGDGDLAAGTALGMLLPGLVGQGATWRRTCRDIENLAAEGEWLALEGEPGVGKRALVRAVHQRRRPGRRLAEIDVGVASTVAWADELRRARLESGNDVLLAHADRLDGVRLRGLATTLQQVLASGGPAGRWITITIGTGAKREELLRLLGYFPRTIEVPPLRHHLEDVPRLVPFLLSRLGYGGKLSCSVEVEQLLSRSSWPGNVAEVLEVLREVVQHRRSGVIGLDDLPPQMLAVSRRRLSPLEAIERDAIVRGLLDANDNKAEAAHALGMSRATIYRKIHEYGILPSLGATSASVAGRGTSGRAAARKRTRTTAVE